MDKVRDTFRAAAPGTATAFRGNVPANGGNPAFAADSGSRVSTGSQTKMSVQSVSDLPPPEMSVSPVGLTLR